MEKTNQNGVSELGSSAQVIRFGFALVIVLYALQLGFVWRFEEPYPALMMPSFAGSGRNADGEMEIRNATIVVTFKSGNVETLTSPVLLAQAPPGLGATMALRHFAPGLARRREAPAESDNQALARKFLPGLEVRHERRRVSGISPAMADWLRNRLLKLYPGRDPQRVDFNWYSDRFSFDGNQVSRQRSDVGSVSVELSDEQN